MQVSGRDFCASRAQHQRQLQFATKTHWQHLNECCSRHKAALATPPCGRQTMKLAYDVEAESELGKTLGKHWSRQHKSKAQSMWQGLGWKGTGSGTGSGAGSVSRSEGVFLLVCLEWSLVVCLV